MPAECEIGPEKQVYPSELLLQAGFQRYTRNYISTVTGPDGSSCGLYFSWQLRTKQGRHIWPLIVFRTREAARRMVRHRREEGKTPGVVVRVWYYGRNVDWWPE